MTFRILLLISVIFAFAFVGCAQKEISNNKPLQEKATSNTEPVKVGAIAPDFTLTSNKGENITLSKVNKPTVLVFYRGYW